MQDMTSKDIAEAASKHPLAACSPEEEVVLFHCQSYTFLDHIAPRNAVVRDVDAVQDCQKPSPPGDEQNQRGFGARPSAPVCVLLHLDASTHKCLKHEIGICKFQCTSTFRPAFMHSLHSVEKG